MTLQELFKDKTRWVQHHYEKTNAKGVRCFCIAGAVDAVYPCPERAAVRARDVRRVVKEANV